MAWQAFAEALRRQLGVNLTAAHCFSSESHAAKQQFITAVFPGAPRIFSDCRELCGPFAHDALTDQRQPVPPASTLFGGFPCTDASSLNPAGRSQDNRSCILRGDLRAGSVFEGIVRYLSKHCQASLLFVALENVPALAHPPKAKGIQTGPSNLTVAMRRLSTECSLVTKVWLLDPRLFGAPQCRPRLWMVGFSRSSLDRCGVDGASAEERLSALMQRMVGSKLGLIDEYLLRESDPAIARVLRDAEAAASLSQGYTSGALLARGGLSPGRARKRSKGSGNERWLAVHMKPFTAQGMEWWQSSAEPDSQTLLCFPELRRLSQRQL